MLPGTPCTCSSISFVRILPSAYVLKGKLVLACSLEITYDTLLLQRQYQSLLSLIIILNLSPRMHTELL